VTWHWLKGHAGHDGNERCDWLATEAIAKVRRDFSPEQLNAALAKFAEAAKFAAAEDPSESEDLFTDESQT
jgi:ribonuclease HI